MDAETSPPATRTRTVEHPGSDSFQLETAAGFRLVQFDPDVFRRRDVRILVDGKRAATLEYPKPASPYQEVPFRLDGHDLIGVVWLPATSWGDGLPLRYDVIANGRSLTDGSSHEEVRASAPPPGQPYPLRFYYLDITHRIAPAAAAPGLVVGVGRSLDRLGWQRGLLLSLALLGAVAMATAISARAWQRVRADEARTVGQRAALGWLTLAACYTVAAVAVVGLLVTAVQT